MKIIDAQVHIWSKTVYRALFGLHRKVERFTAEELLVEMDEAGVDAALILTDPGGWDPDADELAVEAARKYPDRLRRRWASFRFNCPRTASVCRAGATSRA